MSQFKFAISALVLGLTGMPVVAQDFYGSVGLSYQLNDGTNGVGNPAADAPNNEPLNFEQAGLDLTFGSRFGNGYYGQVDFNLMNTDVQSNADDTLQDASMIAFRGGRDFGNFQLGAFLGYIDATIDDTVGDNKVYRTFGGIEGSYSISSKLSAFGQLGGIGGPKGNHGSFQGDDGIHDGKYLIAGVNYELSPKISLNGSFGYADGTTDDDPTYIKTAGVGIDYTFNNPAISAYARLDYTDYYQAVENEGMYVTSLKLGVSYQFGAKGKRVKSLRPIAPLADWLGYTGGHLE